MEYIILGLFAAGLVACLLLRLSTLWALLFGLFLFLFYGRKKGYSWKELSGACFRGASKLKNILLVFVFIGTMTALWRACGTIPMIVVYASSLIKPAIFPLLSFLLCCGISFLTGSSFASAATMGVVCATVGASMGFPAALMGGCVLSGIYFGDRCSPVSTSALLTAQVTGTDIFTNIRTMIRSAAVPFALTCLIYGLLFRGGSSGAVMDVRAIFYRGYVLSSVLLIPAAVILLLAALRVDVKIAMGTSIVFALPMCILYQKMSIADIIRTIVSGYEAADPQIAAMMNGGGILSMVNVALIIFIVGMYSGIFDLTGMLLGLRGAIASLAGKTTGFFALLVVSVAVACVSCNQSLTTILAAEFCGSFYDSKEKLAGDIEDSSIVVPALIPWSIACAVPLATIGAPTASIGFAFYLMLLPLCKLVLSVVRKGSPK